MKHIGIKMRCEIILFTFSVVIFSVNCLRIVYKNEWQRNSKKIQEPRYERSSFVVLCQTGGLPCDNQKSCTTRVQSIQNSHVTIWGKMIYNYLIGEDGNVYEGSGFYKKASFLCTLQHQCILIAFIGDFKDTKPSEKAWKSLNDLLNFGKQFRYLNDDYTLLSSYQVEYENHFKDEETLSKSFMYQTIKTHQAWKNTTLIIEDKLFPV